MTCDGRLFHRRAAATGNALSPTVDRRVRRTSTDVDEAKRSRRLASVPTGRLGAGMLAPDYVGICTQNCHLISDVLRGLQPVKSAKQRTDVVDDIEKD